ncbi:TPA: EscI/YscI/HrpB family type III secretion system inner rod protein, partial [Aeromonas hydrophila]|nr:EscI/YscI/HrpB family type III secretion system inner rod protein [Aeromonas hydrophila]
IKQQFVEAKESLRAELSTPGDDPNSLMQMQWALMRITMQEELIAKTVGKMSQNVETLLKTQ